MIDSNSIFSNISSRVLLQSLLKFSSLYNASLLLSKTPEESGLHLETAMLYGRVGLIHNLVPRASVVEREVEWKALAKAGCHMTKFSNIVGKFSFQLLGYFISVINFPNILENLVM